MGKRSSFKKVPRSLYQTIDKRALPPLLPHLPPNTVYAEPFAGAGALIAQLAAHATCAHASDIVPLADGIAQADAFEADIPPDMDIITNPPWDRPILHRTIARFSDGRRLFLLFDAAWAQTLQATPYLDRCRKIIAVGRLKWIPGTKFQSKDDVAWYEFGRSIPGSVPQFFGRGVVPGDARKGQIRVCYDCGNQIGARAKWMLARRHGVVTTVHRFCSAPMAARRQPAPEPAPLLDFIERSS